MELQQLKGFLAVAQHKSFSKAAEKTFRTQPAITLQIQSLEEELDVKLFDRLGPRRVTLTEEGKILLELVSPIIDNFDVLKDRFNELRGESSKGLVRIATHTSVMVYLLPNPIKNFKKRFPECNISIVNRGRKDILEMLKNGEIDIGITSLPNVPKNIDYKVFAKFKRMLIAPKNHPLSKKRIIKPEDITPYPILLPPVGSNTRAIVDKVFEEHGLEYSLGMEATGRLAIKSYVGMDLGVSIINEFYLSKDDRKNLFVKDMSNYFGNAERGVLTRTSSYISNPVKKFIELLL